MLWLLRLYYIAVAVVVDTAVLFRTATETDINVDHRRNAFSIKMFLCALFIFDKNEASVAIIHLHYNILSWQLYLCFMSSDAPVIMQRCLK